MKIRLLSTVICAAMVSTMVMGCSSGASAPATTAAAAAAPETEVKDTTAGDTETAKAAKGEPVEDVDTGALWYDSTNMDSAEVAPCLYK